MMLDRRSPVGLRPVDEKFPITAVFGQTGKRWATTHRGVDFGCPEKTQIKAYQNGRVANYNGDHPKFGKWLIVEHDGYFSAYMHLSEIFVNVGDRIEQGHVIAVSGATGNVTNPHLHFETRLKPTEGFWNDGTPVEPLFYEPKA